MLLLQRDELRAELIELKEVANTLMEKLEYKTILRDENTNTGLYLVYKNEVKELWKKWKVANRLVEDTRKELNKVKAKIEKANKK